MELVVIAVQSECISKIANDRGLQKNLVSMKKSSLSLTDVTEMSKYSMADEEQ